MPDNTIFIELRKRKVFQTAALYMAVAWGATEILVTVVDQLFLPAWISTLVVIAFVVGFPLAMFLAWTFDVTPEGIRRTTMESRRGKANFRKVSSEDRACTLHRIPRIASCKDDKRSNCNRAHRSGYWR